MTDAAEKQYELHYAQGRDIGDIWHTIAPYFSKYFQRDKTFAVEKVYDGLYHNNALAWLVCYGDEIEAVIVTRNQTHEDGELIVEVTIAAGEDFAGWIDLVMDNLKKYVKQEKATGLRAFCRPGMAKWLRKHGWKTAHEVMDWRIE